MNAFSKLALAASKDKRICLSLLMLAISLTPAFADSIYLRNGQEVKDATISEIGVDDIKYKVAGKDVVYTAKKSDVAIILYANGSKDVFPCAPCAVAPAVVPVPYNQGYNPGYNPNYNLGYRNFGAGARWGAFWLNWLFPGLGSAVIMSDWLGSSIHFLLYTGGSATIIIGGMEGGGEEAAITGLCLLGASFIWNVVRVTTYDKPHPKTASKYGDLNMAILPSRHGNGAAYGLMYNKEF